ncbi:DUF6491 family protein [Cognatiluteimonas weifangensis]|uniref:Lipoprotein n=1 Tax=Cognatiluteimonas weifangensis TaxID=2303539 RepID=A0A372DS10_9GAMM|nr:DUF6491 family protein [Luteimonas weifangensis]RFP62339.1 hypothetical protein D0Y53_00480 [Luteimonas weifangensis]
MRSLPFAIVLLLSLAACASTGRMSEADKLALYSSHAGAPVRDIRYSNPVGWDKVDDQHLLLTMRPSEVWLLRISGPCLDWGGASPTILISAQTGRLSAGFDRIRTAESPASCRIEEIRRVDIAAVRAAQRAAE